MKGYVQLRRGIIEHFKVMSSSEIKVYVGVLVLVNYKTAKVNITLAELADTVNLDRKIIINSLHRLDKFGYVKYTPAKNQWHSNLIEIIKYNGKVKITLPTTLPTPLPPTLPPTLAKDVTLGNSNDLQNPNNNKEIIRIKEEEKKCFSFGEIYLKYPNKVGKKDALRHFKVSVKTEQDWQNIQTALQNYLKSERVIKGFIQNASTWFNNWQDWIVPPIKEKQGIEKFIKE